MRKFPLVLALLFATLVTTFAHADVRIRDDQGGRIGPYLKNLATLRQSGERVVIDGPCLSACTMVLGVIPKSRICVTKRARLGFHAAWDPTPYGPVMNPYGTQVLRNNYPQQVNNWIDRRGGLNGKMIYLQGNELASMYPTCR